jgi:polar amino acid transport system substrate-binding protein
MALMPHRRSLLLLLLLLLLSPLWPGSGRAQTVLRVVGSADPPYRIFTAEGGAHGLYYELLNEAARRLGWTIDYAEVPSARAFKMMETGEADLMMGPLRSPERERFLSYTRIVLPSEVKAFYARAEASPVRASEDLLGRRIAVHRGKRYGAVFDQDGRLQRQEVNDYPTALEMVARGRLDLAVVPERQGDALLQQLRLPLVKQPWRLAGEPPYLVLARASPWLARQAELERVFQAMRDDGSWRRIEARY